MTQTCSTLKFILYDVVRFTILFWVGIAIVPQHSFGLTVFLKAPLDEPDLGDFTVHQQLDVSLFASEPLMVNPTNIDVDHLGRVWVCEVVNYRNKIINGDSPERETGDRILILTDTDHDGVADNSIVFYQGRDIDSAHGICVLGNRAIISAGADVFYLIDTDGDWRADKKQLLFTNIKGVQHDHGIHALVFGPDGKLYFNFGNEGRQLCDAQGQPVIDLAGNLINDRKQPYQQGMLFRCDLDGCNVETLAWNFRNSWEVCVDSFGGIWQSDNDDDGNRGTRINYVFPFGNHGFRDEFTGAAWRKTRSGQAKETPRRHWHQNDPGVVPNLLNTGAGSPTGICVYEGDHLPELFHRQLIHCDAGPNIVRAYPVTAKERNAGYDATTVSVLDGSKQNRWFRPTDVSVAPDGTLLVADWHDSGVGGHRMTDIEGGRIYRLSNREQQPLAINPPNVSNVDGAVAALTSPNSATRYLGHQALIGFGESAIPALKSLTQSDRRHLAARAYWVIDAIESKLDSDRVIMTEAWKTGDPDLMQMALRWSRLEKNQVRSDKFWDSVDIKDVDSLSVAMEMAFCLSPSQSRKWGKDEHSRLWIKLAKKYRSGDRWLLEALGIGAAGNWDRCLKSLLSLNRNWKSDQNLRDIVWRSRARNTPDLLTDLLETGKVESDRVANYFRALDLQKSPVPADRLISMAFSETARVEKNHAVVYEAIKRIPSAKLNMQHRKKLGSIVGHYRGTSQFVELVARFRMRQHYPELFEFVIGDSLQLAVDSIQSLVERNEIALFGEWLQTEQQAKFDSLLRAIQAAGNGRLADTLAKYARETGNLLERRKSAVQVMGTNYQGCQILSRWVKDPLLVNDEALSPAIASALHSSPWRQFQQLAQKRFPLTTGKNKTPLPAIAELQQLSGDPAAGQVVFNKSGTCTQCHVVDMTGKSIGPELSQIGSKLTRQAMFESILFPSAGISHNYENWVVLTEAGSMISGMLVSETDQELEIRDKENILHKIDVDEIELKKKSRISMMPANLHEQLTAQQLADLVEYLMTLKK